MNGIRGRLDLLVPLAVLLETVSVQRSAERLHLSQPAVSRILGRLRETFGDPLLVRVGGRMALTPRAEALRTPLAALLDGAAALLSPADFEPASAERTFLGVMPDVIAAWALPPLLEALARQAPRCRLHLLPWLSAKAVGGEADFVVTTEPGLYPQMRMERVFQDRDVLAYAMSPPDGADWLALDHVAVAAAGLDEDPVDRWLATRGQRRNIVATVPHYLLAARLIAQAPLVGVLPSRLVGALGLQSRAIFEGEEPDQQWLLHPPTRTAEPGSAWMRRLVAETLASPEP